MQADRLMNIDDQITGKVLSHEGKSCIHTGDKFTSTRMQI